MTADPMWLEQHQDPMKGPDRWHWADDLVPAIDPGRVRALRWGYLALDDCVARAHENRSVARRSWAPAVEGVWWARTLDENFRDLLKGQVDYTGARDGCSEGQTVRALAWLRNRHAHDLSVAGSGGEKRSFFSGPGVVFISPSNAWRSSSAMLIGDDKSPHLRPAYDQHVAGRAIDATLHDCVAWFSRVLDACEIDAEEAPGVDKTVM